MRAIRLHAFGPPEALRLEHVADPICRPGQVRLAVAAAGVHLVDTALRRGEAGPWPLPSLPTIPGREVAGTVVELGDGVDATWLGRRAVAHLGKASGGYADQVVTDASRLHALADGVTSDTAVAMIGTGRTAVALADLAALGEGDVALVLGAAGGLGSLLLQMAVHAGALAVGVATGADKLAHVRRQGAVIAADAGSPHWPQRLRAELGEEAVTAVFDGVGGHTGRAAFELLAPGGRMLLHGWASGEPTRFDTADLVARSLTAAAALGGPLLRQRGGLRALEEHALALAADGRLHASMQHFALAEAARAHHALEARSAIGKVVLAPGHDRG